MRTSTRISALIATLALSACGNPTNEAGSTGSLTTPSSPASGAVERPRRGPFGFIQRALASLDLSAEQRARVSQLAAAAQTRHASMRQLRQELAQAVAAQVEDGRIDRVALQPKIDALTAAWKTAAPADRAAIGQLHAILTPAQRNALADTLTAGGRERGRHHGRGGHGKLRELFADLGLTAEQQQKIRDVVHAQRGERGKHEHGIGPVGPMGRMKAHGARLAEAFRSDTFTMDDTAPRGPMQKMMGRHGDRMIGMAEVVLPLLTPAQRVALAQKIRTRALPPEQID
jgi:Spy/CpxP family protein refolding chaperone